MKNCYIPKISHFNTSITGWPQIQGQRRDPGVCPPHWTRTFSYYLQQQPEAPRELKPHSHFSFKRELRVWCDATTTTTTKRKKERKKERKDNRDSKTTVLLSTWLLTQAPKLILFTFQCVWYHIVQTRASTPLGMYRAAFPEIRGLFWRGGAASSEYG